MGISCAKRAETGLGGHYHSGEDSMKAIEQLVRKVGPTDTTVLITGESGTGKEVIARAIHRCSSRKDKSFVAVDCSSLVESLFESELFGHVKGSFTGAVETKYGRFELGGGTLFSMK
jgi:transcriptional regulator with GAF, ATPase, and Fis domain